MKINRQYKVDSQARKHGGKRKKPVRVLIPHHAAGVLSGHNLAQYMHDTDRVVSATYCIGGDGDVWLTLDESLEPYTTGNRAIDTEAITFEVANSKAAPSWEVTDKAFNTLVEVSIDICKRYGIKEVSYTGDKRGNIHLHEWYQNTNCPGPYLKGRMKEYADRINAGLKANAPAPNAPVKHNIKVGDKVTFSGRPANDSYGAKPGRHTSGTFTVDIVNNNSHGVHLETKGWVKPSEVTKETATAPKPEQTQDKVKIKKGAKYVSKSAKYNGVTVRSEHIGVAYDYKLNTVKDRPSWVFIPHLNSYVDKKDVEFTKGASASVSKPIKKGSKVKVLKAIQYDNGKPFGEHYDVYDVLEVSGNRIVIGIGKTTTAAVHANDLKVV